MCFFFQLVLCFDEVSLIYLLIYESSPHNIYSFFKQNSNLSSLYRRHTTYFEKFIKQPALPVIQYSFLGICIGLMVGLFFGCLIYGLAKNDYPLSNLKIVPLPIYFFPSQGKSTVLAGLFVYPALVCGGLGGIFNFLSTVLILQRGREIVYFQWFVFVFVFSKK